MAIKIKKIEDINPQAEPELKPMPQKQDYEIDASIPFVNKITANDYNTIVTNIETIYNVQKIVTDNVDSVIDESNKLTKELQDFYNGIKYTPFPRGSINSDVRNSVEVGGNPGEAFNLVEKICNGKEISSIYLGQFNITTTGSTWPNPTGGGTGANSSGVTRIVFKQMFTQTLSSITDTNYTIFYGGIVQWIPGNNPNVDPNNKAPFPLILTLSANRETKKVVFWVSTPVSRQTSRDASGITITDVSWNDGYMRPSAFEENSVWIASKQAIDVSGLS